MLNTHHALLNDVTSNDLEWLSKIATTWVEQSLCNSWASCFIPLYYGPEEKRSHIFLRHFLHNLAG